MLNLHLIRPKIHAVGFIFNLWERLSRGHLIYKEVYLSHLRSKAEAANDAAASMMAALGGYVEDTTFLGSPPGISPAL